MKVSKIYLGSDHGGFNLKSALMEGLLSSGPDLEDMGCYQDDIDAYKERGSMIDYPEYAHRVAHTVRGMSNQMGILVCGTGMGMSMAANKIRGARAALCHDEYTAKMAREHNDANILCLGERVVDAETGLRIVRMFLDTEFSHEERHAKRVLEIEPGTIYD